MKTTTDPNLTTAERAFAAKRSILASSTIEPTAAQIEAASTIEDLIVMANRQQAGWGKLGVEGHWVIGRYLERAKRAGRGRPKKTGNLPVLAPRRYAQLGLRSPELARRALKIAKLSAPEIQGYLREADPPSVAGAIRYALAKGHPPGADSPQYWVTPPEQFQKLEAEFGRMRDVCPEERGDFDGLRDRWDDLLPNYCNCPFEELTLWVDKAIREHALGKTGILPVPVTAVINKLLEAGAEVRSWGRIPWRDIKSGTPHPNPDNCALFILRKPQRHSAAKRPDSDLDDWLKRMAHYHPGQSPYAPEAQLFPKNPALRVTR